MGGKEEGACVSRHNAAMCVSGRGAGHGDQVDMGAGLTTHSMITKSSLRTAVDTVPLAPEYVLLSFLLSASERALHYLSDV